MSDALKLTMQLTAVDMLSGIAQKARDSIKAIGNASKEVQKDFDLMGKNITQGLKAVAVGGYALKKTLAGIKPAASMQEEMLKVKMNLAGSAKDAEDLKKQLAEVKNTAVVVSADAPFSAEDVVKIQNSLLKAGMSLQDVSGKSGAAFAATALAALSGEAPDMIGDALANIGSQFKLKGKDYKELSDWLVKVDDAAATNVQQLIYGLKMAGSNAAALKISAKDTLTALGVMSPLGERAGASLNSFFTRISQEGKKLKKMGINLFTQDGKFVGLDKTAKVLKTQFGAIKSDEERLKRLTKIFGEEGARAAYTFIGAGKTFEDLEKSAKGGLSMAEKMSIWSEGLNANLAKLSGTSKSTLATLFDPALAPLTEFVALTNKAIGQLGMFAEKHQAVSKTVTYGLGTVAAGALGFGAYKLLKGGLAGSRVLKGVGGFKGLFGGGVSTAAGIAKGKAIEKMTGVQSVFVVNMPDGFGAQNSMLAQIGKNVGGKTVAKDLAKIGAKSGAKTTSKWLAKLGGKSLLKKIPAVGLIAGAGFALSRLTQGDVVGAGGELLSGAASTIPGLGTAASVAIDAGLAARDIVKGKEQEINTDEAIKNVMQADSNAIAAAIKNVINMTINIDNQGKVIATADAMNTHINDISLNRGKF